METDSRAHTLTYTNGDRGERDWADGEWAKKEDWQLDRNSVIRESEARGDRKAEWKPREDGLTVKRWGQIFGMVPKIPLPLSPWCLFIRGQTKNWRKLQRPPVAGQPGVMMDVGNTATVYSHKVIFSPLKEESCCGQSREAETLKEPIQTRFRSLATRWTIPITDQLQARWTDSLVWQWYLREKSFFSFSFNITSFESFLPHLFFFHKHNNPFVSYSTNTS